MFGKAVANVDFKVCCSIDVQLHILDSSCIKKKKRSWKALWAVCVLQCLDQLRKMHLPKLSESFVDDLVELSWAVLLQKEKQMAKTAEHKIAIFFLYFRCTSPCSGEGSCLHMLLLINCIYSDSVDTKAADLLVAESV